MTTRGKTEEVLAAALTEWDRRWREEPERFASEAEHLAGTAEEYGEVAAPYLLSIVAEVVGAAGSFEFTGAPLTPGPTSREILERQARREDELVREASSTYDAQRRAEEARS